MVAPQRIANWVLPLTSVITFLGFLDTYLLIPVIALYASSLGASIGMVGLIVGLYSIINTPANIVFGRWIDKVGHKVPLIIGLVGDAFSMVLYALSGKSWHLALVRILHGAGGAMVAPSTMSVIANYSQRERTGRSMSLYGMALASASLIGYPVSGLIASRLGFKALFLFGAIVVAIAALLSLLLPANSRIEMTTPAPSTDGGIQGVKRLFARKGLVISYAAIFAHFFTFGGVATLLPIYVKKLGMGAFEVGMLLTVFSAMFIVAQLPSGAVADRAGRLKPLVAGLACIVLSLTVLPAMSSFWLLAMVMALYGVGYGLLFPSTSALIIDHTNSDERGLATGMFHALLTAGIAIGAPAIGWVAGLAGTTMGLLVIPVPVFLVLLVALIFFKRASNARI